MRSQVDTLGLHNLACRFSPGKLARHDALNDVVRRALQTSGAPCLLEPPGILERDGKPLCWDCTGVDSFTSTHLIESVVKASSAANAAETVKRTIYRVLADLCHYFKAEANETSGTSSEGTQNIVRDTGRRLT